MTATATTAQTDTGRTCEHREHRPAGWGAGPVCGFPASVQVDGVWSCEGHGGAW